MVQRIGILLSVFALWLAMGLAVGLPGQAAAADGAGDSFRQTGGAGRWTQTPEADVRLLAARESVDGNGQLAGGLEFRLKDGWKIYWRSPGDAGYAPSFDWKASQNLAAAPVPSWPTPHRFEVLGIQTVGYKQHVIFPLSFQATDPAQPLALRVEADYLICSTICVPGHASVAYDLPSHTETVATTDAAHDIEQFRARVPGDRQGITLKEAVREHGANGETVLAVAVEAEPPLGQEVDLFIEGIAAGEQEVSLLSLPPQVRLLDGGRRAVLRTQIAPPQSDAPPELVLTLADGARGLEQKLSTPAFGALTQSPDPVANSVSWLAMVGLALLGGLILNLMPCVLPVLSLKVLAFVGHGGGHKGNARRAFLASAAGIVVAFLGLAGGLIALKSAGAAVGWGIQFQNPWFLGGMIILVLAFAANVWGLFEVRLPSFLSDAASQQQGEHLGGHFVTGLFATILATPCSAPFLGTAVGFALARGPQEIVAIFAALGLGMAAPYIVIALFPGLATRLPRPGRWMLTLKKLLGLALVGTALWLGMVLWSQQSAPGAVQASKNEVLSWQPFDQAELARLVADGKVVFVDVTADWCITCKVNKAAVVERDPVLSALQAPGVVVMRADWTRPNEQIAQYLASFGRYGIPFNAVYGPAAPQGIALSELLTNQQVIDALAAAKP